MYNIQIIIYSFNFIYTFIILIYNFSFYIHISLFFFKTFTFFPFIIFRIANRVESFPGQTFLLNIHNFIQDPPSLYT